MLYKYPLHGTKSLLLRDYKTTGAKWSKSIHFFIKIQTTTPETKVLFHSTIDTQSTQTQSRHRAFTSSELNMIFSKPKCLTNFTQGLKSNSRSPRGSPAQSGWTGGCRYDKNKKGINTTPCARSLALSMGTEVAQSSRRLPFQAFVRECLRPCRFPHPRHSTPCWHSKYLPLGETCNAAINFSQLTQSDTLWQK